MNLFELSAKISADTKDYEKAVKNATKVSKSLKDIMERSATQSETNKNKIKVLAGEYSSAKAKVAVLTEAFNKAAKEEGVTAEKTQKLAKELQEAEKESSDLKGQLDELTKKSKNAGDGFSKLGSALGKGLKTAGKIGVAAVGAAAAGITALTTAAVNNYAEYEQLVGGVETLFKDSSDAVKKYADEAYKTAGLSANEYMSTVTGFSASLLQSLGRGAQTDLDALKENLDEQYKEAKRSYEDQYDAAKNSWKERIDLAKQSKSANVNILIEQRDEELKELKRKNEDALASLKQYNEERLKEAESANNKSVVTAETQALAADLANQAVIDMADNSAKMGTSMELIQNAYAGFAKQNYTMLDNLKLGYGGTQSEMQRLIKNAATLDSSIDANSMSFANIVKAINVVQTEMGITGTTALEAGRTISGSVGAMKSAWTNLLTGLADGNADIGELVNNLVTIIVGDGTENNLGVLGNVMPAVKTALSGASRLVSELLPKIVQKIPAIISENLPIWVEAAVGIVQSLVKGISENQEMLMETAFETITYLAESLIKMLPQIVQLGLDLIVSLANGIAESLPELIPTIVDVVLQIVDTLTNPETLLSLVDACVAIILALADGLIDALPKLIEAVPVIIGNLVKAIIEAAPQLIFAAGELIWGLITGLNNPDNTAALLEGTIKMLGSIIEGIVSYSEQWFEKGKEIFTNIKAGFMEFIDDPKKWGEDLIDNFIGGIKEKWESLKKTVSDVAKSIKDFLGFSEPKKGPLSNFHTYAPDMMDLFAKGIRDNENVITDQIEKSFDFGERTMKFDAEYSGAYGAGVAGGAFGGTSIGDIYITIEGANYRDEQALAKAVSQEIKNMIDMRGMTLYA